MKKNGTKLMMALGLFCLCHVNAADEMDSVGNLHDIFECYSASNLKKCSMNTHPDLTSALRNSDKRADTRRSTVWTHVAATQQKWQSLRFYNRQ